MSRNSSIELHMGQKIVVFQDTVLVSRWESCSCVPVQCFLRSPCLSLPTVMYLDIHNRFATGENPWSGIPFSRLFFFLCIFFFFFFFFFFLPLRCLQLLVPPSLVAMMRGRTTATSGRMKSQARGGEEKINRSSQTKGHLLAWNDNLSSGHKGEDGDKSLSVFRRQRQTPDTGDDLSPACLWPPIAWKTFRAEGGDLIGLPGVHKTGHEWWRCYCRNVL